MPRPIEMGGKMKWKLAVSANCRRDRNSGFRLYPSPTQTAAPVVPTANPIGPTASIASPLPGERPDVALAGEPVPPSTDSLRDGLVLFLPGRLGEVRCDLRVRHGIGGERLGDGLFGNGLAGQLLCS